MAYWLLKTEPEEFSWDDQVKRGAKGEPWSGVRNFTARRYLKEMKKGEKFFFYHNGDEKQVVGIGEVIRDAYHDPNMLPNLVALQKNVDMTRDLGFVRSDLDVNKIADLGIAQEAAKRLK